MTRQPRAFYALDHGSASTSAALIAHVGDRWRLVAHSAAPAASSVDALLLDLTEGVARADPDLLARAQDADRADARAAVAELARVEVRSAPRRRLAVLAATTRHAQLLEAAARRSGWDVVTAAADENDPLQLSRLMLAPETAGIVIGAADPPSSEERRLLRHLAAVAAAAHSRRPAIPVVLAGGAAHRADLFGVDHSRRHGDAATNGEGIVLAPDAAAGQPAGSALQNVMEAIRGDGDESRLAIVRTTRSLAYVLDRTVEVVEVGLDGGLRCRAEPLPGAGHREIGSMHALVVDAGFAPLDPTESMLDAVQNWSSIAFDRYRLPDRLRDVRLAPWGDAGSEGGALRLAGARAALDRLVAATPEMSARPAPDVLVASGGVWQSLPPPVVSLTLVDQVRRAGVSQLALDCAGLLAPLGMIENEEERRQILRDLADDLLLPLGSAIVPSGLREGRSAGRLRVRAATSTYELDLEPGRIDLVDLPPGAVAVADLDFRETVHLGVRGRHFATRVSGGLSGLIVDLRDVPLQFPERAEDRRNLLETWLRALWPEGEHD